LAITNSTEKTNLHISFPSLCLFSILITLSFSTGYANDET